MPPRWAIVSTPAPWMGNARHAAAPPDAHMIALTCACGRGGRGDVWRGPWTGEAPSSRAAGRAHRRTVSGEPGISRVGRRYPERRHPKRGDAMTDHGRAREV